MNRAALAALALGPLVLCALLAGGCASGRGLADSLAREHGFQAVRLATPDYVLAGFLKPGPPGPLAVYLEGDGQIGRAHV